MTNDEQLERESAAYLKRREDELYSAVTEKARQEILIVELTRSGADVATIKAVIAAKAQIERDIPIIGRDLSLSAQSANLSTFLRRMEAQGKQILNEIGGLRTGQTDLQAEFRDGLSGVATTVSTLAETVDGLQQTVDQLESEYGALSKDMAIVKKIVEARPAQRKAEAAQFEERQAAIEARLSELEAEREKYTPEERERLTGSLMRVLAWWEETHGDGNQ